MSSYYYSSLSGGSIRLLRLMPHQDHHSPLQCQLFDCPLLESESTHPYEALSYAWGSEVKPQSVSIDGHTLPIGANLHAALSHLRDRFMERILWIDAICIDQGNPNEKGLQVQSMAKIYATASRVIVWLGEASADSDQALEEIRIASVEQSTESLINKLDLRDTLSNPGPSSRASFGEEPRQSAILKLLRRPWFQRIWVLQEIAAARHVLIKCGHTEIDGYALCSGLSALKLSYETYPDLQALIPSVTYIIRGAVFRPRRATSHIGRFSLNICPLSELLDMYHTRKATERRDKVYALLGMSSDGLGVAGLSADYKIPWRQLFQHVVNFVISEQVSVDTWDDKEIAIIKGNGCVLGEVSSVERDTAWEDRQNVGIAWKNAPRNFRKELEWSSLWTFQVIAKSIQVGDVVCLLQGASRPTIIRPHNNFWAVIMIAVPPTGDLRGPGRGVKWAELLPSVTAFPHDFLLLWDWDMYPGKSQYGEGYEDFMRSRTPTCLKTELEDNLEEATKIGNIGLVLQDIRRYEKARENLGEAMKIFEIALRDMDGLELTYSGHSRWRKGDVELEGMIDLLTKGKGAWALQMAAAKGYEAVVNLLLDTGKVDLDSKDPDGQTPLSWAAGTGHKAIVKLLLDTGKVDPDSKDQDGQTPLSWAARNGHEAVVKLLLDTGKVDPDAKDKFGWTPLSEAVSKGHEAVAKLLLDTGKVDPDAKDHNGRTPLSRTAEYGHRTIVKLLLDTGKVDPDAKDEYGHTPLRRAASNGHEAVIKLLQNIL